MSPNFKTRPHQVEAVRWDPANPVQMKGLEKVGGGQAVLQTEEGPRGLSPGDWIVLYEDGRRRVMKPGPFSLTFEPV